MQTQIMSAKTARSRALADKDAVTTVSAVSAATAKDLNALILAAEEAISVATAHQQAVATAAAATQALDAKARCVQDATLRAVAEYEAFEIEAAAAAAGVGAHDVQIMSNYDARSRAMAQSEAIAAAAEAEKYLAAQVTAAKAATARAAVAVGIADAAVKVFKAQALGTRKTETQDLMDGAVAAAAACGLEGQIRIAQESTPQQVPEQESVAALAEEENMVTPSEAATQAIEIDEPTAIDKRQAGLRLPPSRSHVAAAREELLTHPLQLLDGQTLLYRQDEVGLPDLLSQLAGWSLNLGVAPVQDGGLPRAAEEFAVACGFSAAFGPPLVEVVSIDNSFTTPPHEASMWNSYWDREVAPFDAAERFLRLAKGCKGGAASKVRDIICMSTINIYGLQT